MAIRLASHEQPIPGYRLIERLGRGGFGEVWKVEAPGGLLKAMKFVFGDLESQDDENTRAAEQELKALERVKTIRHPYILSLERYDKIDGQLIITMELADRNLWDRFRECRGLGLPGIPREELLKYMDEAAEALDLMNNHYHIQHLDVKPQNLFLVFNHIKVADFGLAKAFEGVRGTITGGVTPVYAGPETFEGYVSRFTDQYSLAIVFQELLTGTRPFNGSNTKQLLMQHLNGIPDLESLNLSDRPVIERSLSKQPDQRWPTCTDMVRALRAPGLQTQTPGPRPGESLTVTRRVPILASDTGTPGAMTPTGSSPRRSGPVAAPLASRSGVGTHPIRPTSTPAPNLITPKLVTPQTSGALSGLPPLAITQQRPDVAQTARMSAAGICAPERSAAGVLLPALVVAVGHTGWVAAKKLRAAIRERFGSTDAAPHVRFLYVDTDPDAAAAATAGTDGLPVEKILIARLNRPQHYLTRDGLPSVERWLPPGMLYQLPRNPGPAAGVRAFGRLALFDNYRSLLPRLRAEVEAFVTDEAIDGAAAATQLGLRSNRARLYVLASLAGGTGGGMALDLAYLIKNEFRQIGYLKPKVHGILFVPPADRAAAKGRPLANTYAALAELAHFHGGRNKYAVTFDTAVPPVTDSDGPFARTGLVQLPAAADANRMSSVAGMAARHMFLELFTPAGRVLDDVRAEAAALNRDGTAVVHAFAQYRLHWPRPALLRAAAARLAPKLIKRWTAKDSAHLAEPVREWLDEQWAKRKLDLEAVVDRYSAAVKASLREEPDRVFDAFADPIAARGQGGGIDNAEAVARTLEQLLGVVGKPDAEQATPGTLHAVIQAEYKKAAKEAESHLAHLAVAFIEQAQYRLPGAEEVLIQLEARLQRTVDGLEGTRDPLAREVQEGFARFFPLIGGLANGLGRKAVTAELAELVRAYPRKRLKLHILDACLSLYRGLLGSVPEYLREVAFCRTKLTALAVPVGPAAVADSVGPGRMILPHGVRGLDAAADRLLAALPPEDLLYLDEAVQAETLRRFRGVVNVCVTPAHAAPFTQMLGQMACDFLDLKAPVADPAAVFFEHRSDDAKAEALIVKAFDEAAPDLTSFSGRPQVEATVLACPFGAAGDRFREAVAALLPEVGFIPAVLPDDIAFIREYPLLPLAELPQAGPVAREAYDAAARTEASPHARGDIAWAAPG